MSYLSYDSYDGADIEDLVGKKIKDIEKTSDQIDFYTECGQHYRMYHSQSCCEHVYIDAIDGDLEGLIGGEVYSASESTNEGKSDGALLWTYYRIRTDREFVHITWRGSSNGYYSVGVSFIRLKTKEERTEDFHNNHKGW